MNRRSIPLNRRVFLKGVAGAVVAAPFLSSVHELELKAQTAVGTAPRRLVIFYTRNGCLTDRWFPENEHGPLTAADLKPTTLEVLRPYVNKLLLPRGFRSLNMYAQGQSIDPHDQANGSKLTCAAISTDPTRYATAESLDHTIAKQINPGKAAPLVLSVGAASTSIKEILSFSAPNTAYPANVNPQIVYNQLTGIFGAGTAGAPATQADYQARLGQSALDLVAEDLARFEAQNMSSKDKQLIAAWKDLLRETETGGGTGMPPAGSAACSAATASAIPFGLTPESVAAGSPTGSDATDPTALATSFTLGGDLMLKLVALSMICDTNRSIIMLYPGNVTFNWDGIMHTHDHHGLSHRTGDFTIGGNCIEGVLEMIQQIDSFYAKKYAALVGLLDSIPEGESTLLDNTATMWLPELSDGAAHNLNNLPIVIAGSAGGYLKQGAAVNVEGAGIGGGNSDASCADGGTIGKTGSDGGNVPINKLYVTLMNALGCTAPDGVSPVTEFGQFDGMGTSGGITQPGEVSALKASA